MTDVINLLRTSGLSGWLVLAVIYHFGTRGAWRRSRVGPWIMVLCVVPLLTLITGIASTNLGADHAATTTLRLSLMLVLNAMPVWLAVLFVRRQREIGDRHDPDTEPAAGAAGPAAAGPAAGSADRRPERLHGGR